MQIFGFTAIRFSQPRNAMQTAGIPDRRYYRRYHHGGAGSSYFTSPLAVWVEYKSTKGKQRPAQRQFEELVRACGESYVLGGIDQLQEYLVNVGLAKRVPGGIEGIRRSA